MESTREFPFTLEVVLRRALIPVFYNLKMVYLILSDIGLVVLNVRNV